MAHNSLKDKLKSMQIVNENNHYIAVTMLGTEDGQVIWSVQSNWVGFTDENPLREIRAASLVKPHKMINIWNDLNQSYVVVNTVEELALFHILGGNALVEKSLAEQYRPEWIEAAPVGKTGLAGYESIEDLPKGVLNRAPTPKHRMQILKRDDFRCKICGRRASDYVDVELHVHHIHMWAYGGLTHDNNLITLCHTCHKGLDPHEDWNLFDFIDQGHAQFELEQTMRKYWEGVRLYRKKSREIYKELFLLKKQTDKNK